MSEQIYLSNRQLRDIITAILSLSSNPGNVMKVFASFQIELDKKEEADSQKEIAELKKKQEA
ncbi:MAG: hypothetical protein IID32_06210 [Planctomycetes bacterium]|nr:hypothetical protein [Planctomycetota bacterium]